MHDRHPAEEVDYVVVGSGSAGAVIAARLSEDPATRVLLLEAGPRDRSPMLHIPAAARYAFNARRYNWNYATEPEPTLGGRRLAQPRGRVLGGSSSINGLVYLRGNPLDFEAWAEAGATGWSYAEVLPYFQRFERWTRPTNPYQGRDGPVGISFTEPLNPIAEAFLAACREAGYPFTEDVNGYQQEGCSLFPMNAADGLRWSCARAYLRPVRQRRNLIVRTASTADRILFDDRRAVGLAYRNRGRPRSVRVRREVVVSAGVYNSPKLLMLSGVGPADHLRGHGIAVVHDLPDVGGNLMDHLISAIQMECRRPVSLARHLNPASQAAALLRWLVRRDGLLASNHLEAGAFIRSASGVRFPDIQLYLFPIAVAEVNADFRRAHGFQVQVAPQGSPSRGWVRLASARPDDPPRIRLNFLASADDYPGFRVGFRLAWEILEQPAMAAFAGRELLPGCEVRTDDEIDAFVRAHVQSSYHPCGTCRMGQDPMAVVDPACRVRGIEGLRVADASIMPLIPSCNMNSPTIMVGEKASDLIGGRRPPDPSNLPYYVDPEWRTRQRPGTPKTKEP